MQFKNTFFKGMLQDSLEVLSPEGVYTYALNAVSSSREANNFGLVNEEERTAVVQLPGIIKGHSHIEERNQTLYFVSNGDDSEIWLHNHLDNTPTFVCKDSEFGCKWGFDGCEFLYADFKGFNHCNELHAYWSSDCVYHLVNIDEMLNPVRKQTVIDSEECDYFDVFKVTCGPHTCAIPSHNNGSMTEGGVVQFALQFSDNDGNVSNVFDISQPVYLETEDNTIGQNTKMSAKLIIDGLDKTWNDVIVYVIHTVGGVTVIYKMPTTSYGDAGFTYEWYGQKGEIVDVSAITHKSKAWLRGQDLIIKDGTAFYYNIKNERNLNYQKYANNIEVEYVEYEVSMEQQLKYHYPSLMRGEVYAIGIVWKYADGTYSPVFHIPGNPSSTTASPGASNSGNSSIEPTGGSTDGTTGATGNSGSSDNQAPNIDDYNPIEVSQFNTNGQYDRKRNPTDQKDRPNESDKFENQIETDVNAIDTNKADVIAAAECQGVPYGDCPELEEAMTQDYSDITDSVESASELLAGLGVDNPDPDVNTTTTLKDSANLVTQANKNREYVTRERPVLTYTQTNKPSEGTAPVNPEAAFEDKVIEFNQEGVGTTYIKVPNVSGERSVRGDNWTDSNGNSVVEDLPRVISSGKTTPWTSTVSYPDNKDCDGNFFYPQGKVTHHQMPWTHEKPHFVSHQNGVVNKYQPDNYEYAKTFTRPLGLRVKNIKFPDSNELPKPLCPKSPFKIVYVKRTPSNKRIRAKGWLAGIFEGDVYGARYAYPRHGVNSKETVDRFISSGDDGTSRKGTQSDEPLYLFHSPDTDCDNSFLHVTKITSELALKGSGWKHGMYSEGKKPTNQWTGTRIDNRGTRISNNLNHYNLGGTEGDVLGITFAASNTVVTAPNGMELPLMNRDRESSVYLQASTRMAGDDRDNSFDGGVLDHFGPTKCNAPYVALWTDIPDQYGSVVGLKYIDLGLNATTVHSAGTKVIEGLCGDVWIAPYSKRRTSYISNKVGNFFNPPAKPGSPCRQRSWCDSPEDAIFEYTGIDQYPTKLPKSGDKWDPKNYAGLHTIAGPCGAFGLSKNAAQSAAAADSESDFYFPRTLKGLVHTIVESHVNPWLRETGEGDQTEEGKVWYPKLKQLYLDADAPHHHPWEESFLSRFYSAIQQPSLKQLTLKALIRTTLSVIVPIFLLMQLNEMQGLIGGVLTVASMSTMMAYWVFLINTLFTNRRLNQMLGIADCLRDEEGGDLDEDVRQFEDAYSRYNSDYSKVNDVQAYYGFIFPYNTCPCDSCSKDETTNQIYYSNKQNLDSEIDACRTVKLNNYERLPANAGKLQRLIVQNGILWAVCTDGWWAIQIAQERFNNQIAFQQAGTGELLQEPQLVVGGVEEGFAGTMHPNAMINTEFGVFFVDDVANKIYRWNGKPEEISAYGMYNFFKEYLPFCNPNNCYDEKVDDGVHYAFGWDPRYNRLLFTKHDGDNSFTVSYTPLSEGGKWISFHTYTPSAYVWDRNNFYSVDYGKGIVYKHHTKNKYMTPFEVEFNAVPGNLDVFDFKSLTLDTIVEQVKDDKRVKDPDITFDTVAAWNSTQGTGTRPIKVISDNPGKRKDPANVNTQDYAEVRFKKVRRKWNANEFANLVKPECEEQNMLKELKPCEITPKINEEIFSCTTFKDQDGNQRRLSDRYLTFRYTLNRPDVRLYLLSQTITDNSPEIEKE